MPQHALAGGAAHAVQRGTGDLPLSTVLLKQRQTAEPEEQGWLQQRAH